MILTLFFDNPLEDLSDIVRPWGDDSEDEDDE